MFGIGSMEVVIVAALALILFGPTRMAEILRSLGQAMGQLRKAVAEVQAEIDESVRTDKKTDDP